MSTRRLGILGGTFDPIHRGHLDLGRAAQAALDLTEVLVVPANIPPHRPQPFASSYHRFAMTALAVAGLEGWRASDLELRAGAQSFTTDTLKGLHQQGHPVSALFFVIGADAFAEIEGWKDSPGILDRAHFAVVPRPSFAVEALPRLLPRLAGRMARRPFEAPAQLCPMIFLIDAPTSDVSSTAIRRRRAAGESIEGLVPPAVRQHIEQHGLYTSTVPDPGALDAQGAPAADRLHG